MNRTAENPGTIQASALLAAKLHALRRRHVTVQVATGLATLLIVSVELLAVAMFLDWWIELPWGWRVLSLAGQLGASGFLTARLVLGPLLRQPDEDELALWVEKARPGFRTRLIASIQLSRPGAVPAAASSSLVSALIAETEDLARPEDFARTVSTERLKKFGAMAMVVPLIALLGFAAGRETCVDLIKRVLLSNVPVPRRTRVLVPEGNRTIGIGDTVRLEAFVQGIVPGHGKVEVRHRSRRPQEFSLEQNRANPANFARTLENVQDSFTYQFRLGDGVSEVLSIQAIPRPTVATIECDQDYPAYTKLKSTRRNLGDLTLLAGSVLHLKAIATKDVRSASLKLAGLDQELTLAINPQAPRELSGQFMVPARGLTGFQIQTLDTVGMESRDSAIYRVDLIPDKAPVVRLTYPDRKEDVVTRHAILLLGFKAGDDFEISLVRLKYKIDTLEGGAEKSVDLELDEKPATRLRRRYEWNLDTFKPALSEGSVIEYWIEVEDNNDVTGPGIGSTDHQMARVVSEAEKRADLLNRAGDYLGSISDVAADQERLNRNLGSIIRAKAGLR